MKYRKTKEGYVIRLFKGEHLKECLMVFCAEHEIHGAFFVGLGAVLKADIALYDLEKGAYESKLLNGPLEITNMTGNVSLNDGKPFIHAHVTLADPDMNAYGGHLNEAEVGPTCEIYMRVFEEAIERTEDNDVGLDLLDL